MINLINCIKASFEAKGEQNNTIKVVLYYKEGKSEVIWKVSCFYTTLVRRKVAWLLRHEHSGVYSILYTGGCDLSPTFSLIALGAYIIKLRSRLYITRA